MKKFIIFIICCFSFLQFHVFADEAYDAREYLEYVSFGYNAVETIYRGEKTTDFYMVNNPLYSSVRIMDFDYGIEDFSLLSAILGSRR